MRKFKKCPKLNRRVGINSEICKNCKLNCVFDELRKIQDEDNEEYTIDDLAYDYQTTWGKRQKKRNLILIIIASVLLICAIIFISILVKNVKAKNNEKYIALTEKMQDLDEDKLYSINSILDSLSSRYKDVKTIKEEYQLIRNNYSKMYVDIKSTNRLGEGARKAYLELYNFDQEHDNWNLETLLNQIKVIDNIIYGAEFIDEESNYFMWGDNESGNETLHTNLPFEIDTSKSYYFYYMVRNNKLCFGYEDQENFKDKILCYRIESIICDGSNLIMEMYCFSNNQNYTLKYTFK